MSEHDKRWLPRLKVLIILLLLIWYGAAIYLAITVSWWFWFGLLINPSLKLKHVDDDKDEIRIKFGSLDDSSKAEG